MQVTETDTAGLKRSFRVVIPADELDERLTERLSSMKDEIRIRGFRPGKVPISHLKRLFGRSTMAEIINGVLSEVAQKTLIISAMVERPKDRKSTRLNFS